MVLQDNVLKAYLKNVYFLSGTPCGGKTTISRELAKKYGMAVYHDDERFEEYRCISSPAFQPSMNKTFRDADEFFGRTIEEYRKWLLDNEREKLDFVLLDLIRLSQDRPILCDCDLTVEEAERLTDPERVVFLIREPSNLIDEYCDRPDHQDFSAFLDSASDTKRAREVCNATLRSLNGEKYEQIKHSRYFWLERTAQSTVDETVRQVEQHFRLAY